MSDEERDVGPWRNTRFSDGDARAGRGAGGVRIFNVRQDLSRGAGFSHQ